MKTTHIITLCDWCLRSTDILPTHKWIHLELGIRKRMDNHINSIYPSLDFCSETCFNFYISMHAITWTTTLDLP
jgi:hypothetical protein